MLHLLNPCYRNIKKRASSRSNFFRYDFLIVLVVHNLFMFKIQFKQDFIIYRYFSGIFFLFFYFLIQIQIWIILFTGERQLPIAIKKTSRNSLKLITNWDKKPLEPTRDSFYAPFWPPIFLKNGWMQSLKTYFEDLKRNKIWIWIWFCRKNFNVSIIFAWL